MIFHLKKKIRSIFNTLFKEERSEAWLKNYAWPFWPIKIDVCTVRVPFMPSQRLPSSRFPIVTHLTAVSCACVCFCVCVCAVQATISLARCRYIDSFTHTSLTLSIPLALLLLLSIWQLFAHPPTQTPHRAEPSVFYVYLTKNAGMPIKRAQKVVLNMEQVLWLASTSRTSTLCQKEAH